MDVERLVVRLLADATSYNRIIDSVQARLSDFAAYATVTLGKTAIELAANYERAGVAFEVMTGSALRGQKILRDVANLALETPFSTDELIKSAKQVKAFGFEVDDIIPILSRLGDVASGTGSDMDRIILAFGQVRTTGRLMGQELRQFTNAGVPILENLAKVMGVAVAQVPNLVRQGKVGFSDVAAAFNLMTNAGGIFYEMNQRINKESLSGRWQNFKENIAKSARELGEAAVEGLKLKDVLTSLSGGGGVDSGRAKEFFKDIGKGFEVAGSAADRLWQNLKRLWKSVSDGAGVVKEWFLRNKELIAQIAAAVLIVKAFTFAWAAIPAIIVAVNLAVATVVQGFALLLVALNPATVAVLGIIAALEAMGAFAGIGEILGKGFRDIGDTFNKTWKGITESVKSGDLEGAWDIAMKGMLVGWKTLIVMMEAAWHQFSGNIINKFSAGGEFVTGISLMYNDAFAFVEKQFGNEAQVEATRQKVANGLIEAGAAKQAAMKRGLELDGALMMRGINNIPEKKRLDDLLKMSEMVSLVGKQNKGHLQNVAGGMGQFPNGGKFYDGDKINAGVSRFDIGQVSRSSVLFSAALRPIENQLIAEVTDSFINLHRMIEEQRSGKRAWTGEEIKAAAATAAASADSLRKFHESLKDVGATAAKVANIRTPLQMDPEVLTFARDLQKTFEKGVGPMDTYRKSMDKVNQAFEGAFYQYKIGTADKPFANNFDKNLPGLGSGGGLESFGTGLAAGIANVFTNPMFQGIITESQRDFGRFQAFQALPKLDRTGGAGAAQLFGSREAQETINRSNAQMMTVEQQVLQAVRDGNLLQRESADYQRQVAASMKKIEGQQPAVPANIGGARP